MDKDIDLTSGVISYLYQRSIPFSGSPPNIFLTCPKCRTQQLTLYTPLGTWRCSQCHSWGEFEHFQQVLIGKIEITRDELAKQPVISGPPQPNCPLIDMKQVKYLSERLHKNLKDSPKIAGIVSNNMGITQETINSYHLGWTGKEIFPLGLAYYRNRLSVPILEENGEPLTLRFWLVPGIVGVSSSASQVLNLKGWDGETTFWAHGSPDSQKVWIVENEMDAILLTQAVRRCKVKGICIISPISRGHQIPLRWKGISFAPRGVVIFCRNTRRCLQKAAVFKQTLLAETKIVCFPESISGVRTLLQELGDMATLDFLLEQEKESVGKEIQPEKPQF